MKLNSQHLITGTELSAQEIEAVLQCAIELKKDRLKYKSVLQDKHLALIFEKPSLRTRFSFTIAMRELGGDVIESVSASRKSETPEDQMRVLQGYCHAVMIRTHDDEILQRMQTVATIPIINGLTELYHPCQTLADLVTLQQRFSQLKGLTICYLGDGNNILHSLLLMAPLVGVKVNYCCPPGCEPEEKIVSQAPSEMIAAFATPQAAVRDCHAVYTDVWTSMGFESRDENLFKGFQVNEALMALAQPKAIFMHCMPMERGKEVSVDLPDQTCSAIFEQSENRMHVQKALLFSLLS
ncbi:MAG: ornithine carbamoyltransferase [Gammaproteobacteria bacterium]